VLLKLSMIGGRNYWSGKKQGVVFLVGLVFLVGEDKGESAQARFTNPRSLLFAKLTEIGNIEGMGVDFGGSSRLVLP